VGVSPGGVHDETALVGSNGLGECLGSFVDDDVSPSLGAWHAGVDDLRRVHIVPDLWNDCLGLETGLTGLTLDRGAVDGQISEVAKQFLSSVLRSDQLEELWSVIDERRPGETRLEDGVREQSNKERDVGLILAQLGSLTHLDTSDSELDKSPEHLSSGDLVRGTADTALDQERVVVRLDRQL
jgi:hypothetical protein